MTRITSKPFGSANNTPVTLYTFQNAKGCEVSVTDYGGTVVSIKVPDREGRFDDVVLGYDSLDGYLTRRYFFGAAIGRCCNRIGGGTFQLNGKAFQLNRNEGENHLHGGFKGFDTVVWESSIKAGETGDTLELHHISPDGDENYPGRLDVTILYSFNDNNELTFHYKAKSDKDTVCNLTNHSYFNLAGHNSGSILGQEVKINAESFTETDLKSIPTGKLVHVEGTPMDFRSFHTVGERVDSDYYQLNYAGGYDHNWVLSKGRDYGPCAELIDRKSGRRMTCLTTLPCVQFYCGNYIEGDQAGKGGFIYKRRAGLCFETQFAPDAVNHPNFISPVLKASEEYDEKTTYRFDVI